MRCASCQLPSADRTRAFTRCGQWSKWPTERLVYVVHTDKRGAGAVSHVDHAHHVTVDVLFTITEYIREANRTGQVAAAPAGTCSNASWPSTSCTSPVECCAACWLEWVSTTAKATSLAR